VPDTITGPLRRALKRGLLGGIRGVTSRYPVLLPMEAHADALFLLKAPYRVDGDVLSIELLDSSRGQLQTTLLGYTGHAPNAVLWESGPVPYDGPCEFAFDLQSGATTMRGRRIGVCARPVGGRRFSWRFVLATDRGLRTRITGHYRPALRGAGEADYFTGSTYVDYDAQARGEAATIKGLMTRFGARGPVLDVGCATGLILDDLRRSGYPAVGIDRSAWAVEQANARVGEAAAFVADLERDGLPPEVTGLAPFGTVVLWAVFEHFRSPFGVLASLGAVAAPGSVLLVNTTNANSLTRRLFGADWEGYYDETHHGVDALTVPTLRSGLADCGWDARLVTTDRVWSLDADASAATLRDWWAADGRFRRLLAERDLGDFVTCVAVRR
jgi:SAM-dependent methyltransferase